MTDRDAAWESLGAQLERLTSLVKETPAGPERLYAFADGFLALAKNYHRVILAEGKTSMRVEAALTALSLKTPKSRLQNFLSE